MNNREWVQQATTEELMQAYKELLKEKTRRDMKQDQQVTA